MRISDWSSDVCSSDLVNGEGTIHRTSERDRARWLTELGPIASKHGLPSFLVNAGLHDIDHGSAANLRAYTGIYVRDRHSRTILQGYGIASQVLPDLSMSADFAVSGPRSDRKSTRLNSSH